MDACTTTERIEHPALAGPAIQAFGAAGLSDRQRLGLLLEGATLLAHLDLAGWFLPAGWRGAGVAADGHLGGLAAAPGTGGAIPQRQLRRLVRRLFGAESEIAGRGEARRIARSLMRDWSQELLPISVEGQVTRLLDEAEFLWNAAAAIHRGTLAAVHVIAGQRLERVVGRPVFAARLRAALTAGDSLRALIERSEARRLWRASGEGRDPRRLASSGRWRSALRAWDRAPPKTASERLEVARIQVAAGLFEQALATLGRCRLVAARALRAVCLERLGRLGAAKRALIRLEDAAALEPGCLLSIAELAVRLYGNLGTARRARRWVERALQAGDGRLRLRAEIVAATAAWSAGDLGLMASHLRRAARAREIPELEWRYRQARGLLAIARGDGRRVVRELGAALGADRRRLEVVDAAGLWNDLAIGRALVGDLAAAERGFGHAVRLFSACEGPRKTTLALVNLAEVRLRRGRPRGVEGILDEVSRRNREAGNRRAEVQDLELWGRYELVRGRPRAALSYLDRALDLIGRYRPTWRRSEVAVLRARAFGWLGRPSSAAASLTEGEGAVAAQLEPEEVAPLWLLAGDAERALSVLAPGAPGRLVGDLARGGCPPPELWEGLRGLEPYRAARLVFDLEQLFPGAAPSAWVRSAAATMERVGATAFAERLRGREVERWAAVERFCRCPRPDLPGARELLREAGYADARLAWCRSDEQRTVSDGGQSGASFELAAVGGRWAVSAPEIDAPLRALVALVATCLTPEPAACEREVPRQGIVGRSPVLRAALERCDKLAASGLSVLIQGETGTGKELFARRVHRRSERRREPFLPINCAALSESLLLSDLFGHVRGAFTGADRDRAGIFETARGGTVFLDEIGDLPLVAQGKLLRALQEGEVRRVGESAPRPVDVRLVAATHRNLERSVDEGSFRHDLLFRLRIGYLELPPLRDRGDDVVELARHFLERTANGQPMRLAVDALARLRAYRWPGNVRELKNVVDVAVALAESATLHAEDLDLPDETCQAPASYHAQVEEFRRQLVARALDSTDGNRAAAARRLGLSRQALSYLTRQLKIG